MESGSVQDQRKAFREQAKQLSHVLLRCSRRGRSAGAGAGQ